jgi:hypothetical protein
MGVIQVVPYPCGRRGGGGRGGEGRQALGARHWACGGEGRCPTLGARNGAKAGRRTPVRVSRCAVEFFALCPSPFCDYLSCLILAQSVGPASRPSVSPRW